VTQQASYETMTGGPPANYERYFVPAIGAPLAHALIARAKLRPGEQVLDVACGTGVVTRLAAERVGDGDVVGVDLNAGMLDVARNVARDTAIEWHEASAEALPLGDATFDVVLCQMGLQFFPDRPGALREMRRVLRPGGRVILNVPGPTPSLFGILERALSQEVGPEAAGFVATVFSLHDIDEIRGLFAAAGFTDVQARSKPETLSLPTAEDFLWQYVYSTPLAGVVAGLDEDARAALQRDVVTGWEPYTDADGRLVLEVDMTTVTARRT
jgi:ubiquinone/menaquinone biosynthesis C-methylase UbiE